MCAARVRVMMAGQRDHIEVFVFNLGTLVLFSNNELYLITTPSLLHGLASFFMWSRGSKSHIVLT